MAAIPEIVEFTEEVYQLEVTDPNEAGPDGVLNRQGKSLANRTRWLKAQIDAMFPPYCVREIDVPEADVVAYLSDNFDGTGLGKSDGMWPGHALCNGANGTRDRGGRTSIGHGNGYVAGATGGSADAVVVSHTHTFGHTHGVRDAYYIENDAIGGTAITGIMSAGGTYTGSGDSNNDNNRLYYRDTTTISQSATVTGSTGESGVGKNMQPYIVTIFVMKLP